MFTPLAVDKAEGVYSLTGPVEERADTRVGIDGKEKLLNSREFFRNYVVADALSIFMRADQVCFCELVHMLRQNGRRDPERTGDLHSVHAFAVLRHEVKNPNPQGIGKRAKKTLCFIRGRIHAQHYNGNYFLSKTFLKFYMSTKNARLSA